MRKICLTIALLLMICSVLDAQKLPSIQENSFRAPAAIKVDGKATEWNDQFQAYNKATEIYYTLSNDNSNLYLAVQATDPDIINKIISSGLTFTINGTGKMNDQDGMAITFPVLDRNNFPPGSPPVDLDNLNKYNEPEISFIIALNKDLNSQAKDIKLAGIKEIRDPLISIYNTQGIKTATLFDEEKAFVYELAIPLKYLELSVNEEKPFAYNIRLNGLAPGADPATVSSAIGAQRKTTVQGIATVFTPDSGVGKMHIYSTKGSSIKTDLSISRQYDVKEGTFIIMGQNADRIINLISPTDFSGEYNLSK